MNSELIKLLIENAGKFGFVDAAIILVLASCVIASAVAVIHWIYKHAFEKQGEVIKSQDKLIDIKDKAIAAYEQGHKLLEEEKLRSDSQLSEASKRLAELHKEVETVKAAGRQKEADLLLYAATQLAGVLTARLLLARIEFCHRMRQLAHVYGAVLAQHNESTAVPSSRLLARIDRVEDFYLEQSDVLKVVTKARIDGASKVGLPDELFAFNKDELPNIERQHELEDFVVTNALPLLQKYEPPFAERVERSYKARKPFVPM